MLEWADVRGYERKKRVVLAVSFCMVCSARSLRDEEKEKKREWKEKEGGGASVCTVYLEEKMREIH